MVVEVQIGKNPASVKTKHLVLLPILGNPQKFDWFQGDLKLFHLAELADNYL